MDEMGAKLVDACSKFPFEVFPTDSNNTLLGWDVEWEEEASSFQIEFVEKKDPDLIVLVLGGLLLLPFGISIALEDIPREMESICNPNDSCC